MFVLQGSKLMGSISAVKARAPVLGGKSMLLTSPMVCPEAGTITFGLILMSVYVTPFAMSYCCESTNTKQIVIF